MQLQHARKYIIPLSSREQDMELVCRSAAIQGLHGAKKEKKDRLISTSEFGELYRTPADNIPCQIKSVFGQLRQSD